MLSKNETNNTRGDLLTASSTDVVQSTSQLTSANPRPCHIVCNTPDKQLYSVASAICRYLYRYSCFVLFCCAHPANRIYTVTYLYSRGWDRRGASHGSCKGLPAKRSRAPSSLSRGRGVFCCIGSRRRFDGGWLTRTRSLERTSLQWADCSTRPRHRYRYGDAALGID